MNTFLRTTSQWHKTHSKLEKFDLWFLKRPKCFRQFWLQTAINRKRSRQSSKLWTSVCEFGYGCWLPPDVFPSQMHCCLLKQAALKELSLKLYSRGHVVTNLMIASIFLLFRHFVRSSIWALTCWVLLEDWHSASPQSHCCYHKLLNDLLTTTCWQVL